MSTMPVTQRMTAGEYLAEEFERFTELIAGEVVVHQPLWVHEVVCTTIHFHLLQWIASGPGRGAAARPIDVLVSERDVYAPDVLWYREGRVPGRDDPRPYPLPDLVVEARSPSTWRFDIGAKKSAYERAGLRELWLVDTDGDVLLAFRRSAPASPAFDVALELTARDTLTAPLLPGFSLALDAVFEHR